MFFITSAGMLNRFRFWTRQRSVKHLFFLTFLFLCCIHIFIVPSFAASTTYVFHPDESNLSWTHSQSTRTGTWTDVTNGSFVISGSSATWTRPSGGNPTLFHISCASTNINLLFNSDYVMYFKVDFSFDWESNLSGLSPTTNLNGKTTHLDLTFNDGSQISTLSVPVLERITNGNHYKWTFYVEISKIVSLQFFSFGILTQGGTGPAFTQTVTLGDLVFTPVNSVEYEQWQTSQNIENALTQSPSSVIDQNQQTGNAAQDFNNEVNDFAELNGSLDRPQANTDFQTNIDLITGGLYDYSVVQSFFTPLYESIPIAFFLLVTSSFCVIGYVLYGKRG